MISGDQSPHLDRRRTPAERAALLRSRMTIHEKAHQLVSCMPWVLSAPDGSDPSKLETVLEHPPGHVAQLILDTPAALAAMVVSIQRRLVERTRLGIPALFHAEALNGVLAGGQMVFPTAIGLAATWSPELVESMARLTQQQMVRTGLRHALSPVMDVSLDPRWGRVHETYGEDPYLVGAMAVAFTRGLQGTDPSTGVIATGKHFLGYANPEGGLNASAVGVGARRLRDLYAFPFEAAIQEAGLGSVMNSYSEIDGIPVAASREVLTDLLRGTLGFEGFVSADYASIEQLVTRQRVAPDAPAAARLALTAGLDVEFPSPFAYGDVLAAEVEAGRIDPGLLDLSVERVLQAKFSCGLFEHPYPAEHIEVAAFAAEGADLSSELAARGVVLLENAGVLPLAPDIRRIAVIGPHADRASLHFPAYTYPSWRQAVDAIHLGGAGTMVGVDPAVDDWHRTLFDRVDIERLVHDRYGARSLAEELADRFEDVQVEAGSGFTGAPEPALIASAVLAAQDADIVVLALGGASLWFNGERTEGEASDTADISLPEAQRALLAAVVATGVPTVLVLVGGRPYVLPAEAAGLDALLVSAYAGPFGPRAIADVLSGRVNPSGRLPYSIPRHVGQVPVYHHQRSGSGFRTELPPATSRHYLDSEATPRYPFGAGIGYSTFELHALRCDDEISTDGVASISVDVTNTGARAGAAVVQLYIGAQVEGVTRPHQQLCGFVRVDLEAGETRGVHFRLDATQLASTGVDRQLAVHPGVADVVVGLDSADDRLRRRVRVTGVRRPLRASDRTFFSTVLLTPGATRPGR